MSDQYLNECIRHEIADELVNNSKDAVGVHIPEPHITDEHVKERKRRINEKCYLEGIKRAKKQIHYEAWYHAMRNGECELDDPLLQSSLQKKKAYRMANTTVTPWMFVTVNPEPACTLELFKKKVEKYVKRKMIKQYAYVYEQRGYEGGPPIGAGFHAHILIEHTEHSGPFRTLTQNAFEKVVGDVKNSHYLKIEANKGAVDVQNRHKYMFVKDDKKDATKPLKQAGDEVWRNDMNLSIVYESEGFVIP